MFLVSNTSNTTELQANLEAKSTWVWQKSITLLIKVSICYSINGWKAERSIEVFSKYFCTEKGRKVVLYCSSYDRRKSENLLPSYDHFLALYFFWTIIFQAHLTIPIEILPLSKVFFKILFPERGGRPDVLWVFVRYFLTKCYCAINQAQKKCSDRQIMVFWWTTNVGQ